MVGGVTRIGQLLALARLTAAETLRQPVCLLLTASAVVATALCPLVMLHNFGEDGRLARDGGLAFHMVFGLFVAGYAAASALSREMRSGTAAAVLAKPVPRGVFFLAKYLGVVAVVGVFSVCASLATLLAERTAERFVSRPDLVGYVADRRLSALLLAAPAVAFALAGLINYRTRRSFQSTAFALLPALLAALLIVAGMFDQAGRWAPYDPCVQWRILPASLLVTEALCVLAAIALALSTRLTVVPIMTGSAAVLAAGLLWELAPIHGGWAAAGQAVIPDWQRFWAADWLARGGHVPPAWLLACTVYAVALAAAALAAGALLFEEADVTS